MGRIGLAWKLLTNAAFAAKVKELLDAPKAIPVMPAAPIAPVVPASRPEPPKPARNDAVSLLATLQREGRLIDFLREPIDAYSDAQIGAAVRDIHRDCAAVLERQFGVRPVLEQPEGATVAVGSGAKSGRIRCSGKVSETGAASGVLVHHGWQVTKCELPAWTGDAEAIAVIAPAEVEIR